MSYNAYYIIYYIVLASIQRCLDVNNVVATLKRRQVLTEIYQYVWDKKTKRLESSLVDHRRLFYFGHILSIHHFVDTLYLWTEFCRHTVSVDRVLYIGRLYLWTKFCIGRLYICGPSFVDTLYLWTEFCIGRL